MSQELAALETEFHSSCESMHGTGMVLFHLFLKTDPFLYRTEVCSLAQWGHTDAWPFNSGDFSSSPCLARTSKMGGNRAGSESACTQLECAKTPQQQGLPFLWDIHAYGFCPFLHLQKMVLAAPNCTAEIPYKHRHGLK